MVDELSSLPLYLKYQDALNPGQYNMLERSWRILLVYQKAGCNDTLVIIFIKTSKMESIKTRLMLIPLQLSPQLKLSNGLVLAPLLNACFRLINRLFRWPIIWYSSRSSCTGWKFHLPHKKTQTASITRPQSFSTYKSWGWKNGPFLCVSSACITYTNQPLCNQALVVQGACLIRQCQFC